MCDMINEPESPKSGKHCDLEASQIKKIDFPVRKITKAISHFTSPWKIADKEKLYCLASGAPILEEIEKDILRADEQDSKEHIHTVALEIWTRETFF